MTGGLSCNEVISTIKDGSADTIFSTINLICGCKSYGISVMLCCYVHFILYYHIYLYLCMPMPCWSGHMNFIYFNFIYTCCLCVHVHELSHSAAVSWCITGMNVVVSGDRRVFVTPLTTPTRPPSEV